MKNKILLSTLLGSALLVGCTADDALNVDKVANKVNPDAPVFTVSFNDSEDNASSMRASMTSGGMSWQSVDKMSLYHGGGNVTAATSSTKWKVEKNNNDEFLKEGQLRNFDAIYTKGSVDANGNAVFGTQSMVTEGLAIMVFPADTAYQQTGKSPIVKISNEQDVNTKNLTPYVSEVLQITEHGNLNVDKGENTHSAGYGRSYDISLRRIAGQLRLKLNGINGEAIEAAGVPALEYRKVTMKVSKVEAGGETYNVKPFTTASVIKVGRLRYTEGKDQTPSGDPAVGLNPADGSHAYWMYTPWIEPVEESDNISAANTISTTDLNSLAANTAIFTFLPYDDRTDKTTSVYDEAGKPKYNKMVVTVETNYGSIEVTDPTNHTFVWSDNKGNEAALADGLAAIMQAMFAEVKEGNRNYPLYRGQIVAGSGDRNLTVDLSKLKMDQLHITSSAQLVDVLKLYNALKPEGETTFYLDGDNNGVFTMTQAAWEAVEAQLKTTANKVNFVPCSDHGKTNKGCIIVRLTNEGGTPNIPELNFGENSNASNGIDLQLSGAWAWTGVNDATTQVAYKNLKFGGVKTVTVISGATLALNGPVAAANYTDGTDKAVSIVNEYNGTVNTTGNVTLALDLENKGIVNVKSGHTLQVQNAATLTNRETQDETKVNDVYTATGRTTAKRGEIYVTGNLTVGNPQGATTPATIVNLGYIKQETATSRVYITKNNSLDNGTTETAFARKGKNNATKDHLIGTVELASVGGQTYVTVNNENAFNSTSKYGFIKLTVTAEEPKAADFGKANYIVLAGNCKKIKWGTVTEGEESVDYMPSTVKFIEIASSEDVMFTGSNTYNIEGLIIPAGYSMTIDNGSKVIVWNTVFAEGDLWNSGILQLKQKAVFNGYFGGDTSDEENNVHGGGQILHQD